MKRWLVIIFLSGAALSSSSMPTCVATENKRFAERASALKGIINLCFEKNNLGFRLTRSENPFVVELLKFIGPDKKIAFEDLEDIVLSTYFIFLLNKKD